MGGMRVVRVLRAGVVAGAAFAVLGAAPGVPGPEADLAYHGSATMTGGRFDVRFTPRNHGPSAVPDATVRLRWSKPLAASQTLPEGCARSGERAVVCRTGALAADEIGERMEVRVRLRDVSSEVVLELDTVWGGGAVDGNRANDQQRVLVLDTGDRYYF